MLIKRVAVRNFRNLRDFELSFDDRHSAHAVIGQNGSGKSNLMEALITIFRDLDLNNVAALAYELDYEIRGHSISVKAEAGKRPRVSIDGAASGARTLSEGAREYLPSHVFVYYSGKNERVERLFQAHQERFTRRMVSGDIESLPEELLDPSLPEDLKAELLEKRREKVKRTVARFGDEQLQRLFYCRGGHTQLVLLACLLSGDENFKHLLRDLNIEELESALFVLKQPHRLRGELREEDILHGDPRFWYARGAVVEELLSVLWDLAVAPIDEAVPKQIDFRGRKEEQKQLYLFLKDGAALRTLGDEIGGPERFFRYAAAAYSGDLIDEVRINVRHRNAGGDISYSSLSEGELQLLSVLGLMRITSADDCLFLLDEPDTHLNPIWKLRYFEEIEKVIASSVNDTIVGRSQIIVATHDPMMIGGLVREQVRILRKGDSGTAVEIPDQSPRGMGVAGLLKSEMFGLPSTLDGPTLEAINRRNELAAKREKRGKLDDCEAGELEELQEYLADLGFSREYRDPLYQLFIKKMYEVRAKPLEELLSPLEIKAQEALAERIVAEMVKKERTEALLKLAGEHGGGPEA